MKIELVTVIEILCFLLVLVSFDVCLGLHWSMETKTFSTEIDTNRTIIGKLLSLSIKANWLINFEEAPKHPFYNFPLCLAHPDGSMRKPQIKWFSVLFLIILYKMKKSLTNTWVHMFLIWWHKSDHVSTMFLKHLNNLFKIFFSSIPNNVWRVDLVLDTFF